MSTLPGKDKDVGALPLDRWIERQAAISAKRLAGAISATTLTFRRRDFGQTVRPAKGSVLASPETKLGSGPDYFFHWLRDAAAVLEAVRLLARRRPDSGAWTERFEDCVRFSLGLARICGDGFLRGGDFRRDVEPAYLKFVRPDAEIAALAGDRVLDDVRYNADGTLDFIHWGRPQHDGPALEALVALRFWQDARSSSAAARAQLAELVRRDLDYACRRVGDTCYDIWEEEPGQHYYPHLVQRAALEAGARWIEAEGDRGRAAQYRAAARRLEALLDAFWSTGAGIYRSRQPRAGAESPKALDMSVILAVLHAGRESGPHSVRDERARATLARIEAHFAGAYPLNRGHARPFALGRYPGDRYYNGGAWYLCSFAAAEFYYRCAAAERGRAWLERGDAILAAVRRCVPASGELSEQFDPATGAPVSARNLTWSYAAFITAAEARGAALAAVRASGP